jgi:hypothetical protein
VEEAVVVIPLAEVLEVEVEERLVKLLVVACLMVLIIHFMLLDHLHFMVREMDNKTE